MKVQKYFLWPVYYRSADEVSADDDVLVHNGNELVPEKVLKVSKFLMKGL